MEKNPATIASDPAGDMSENSCFRDGSLLEGLNVIPCLPEELIAHILSYLPVKFLLCLKCISKTWCSLIESPSFVKMHLKTSTECKTNLGILAKVCLCSRAKYSPEFQYYSADFHSLNDTTAVEIDDPLKTRLYGADIMGSSNGLFCMFTTNNDILLCNPSTRKSQKLPVAPIDLPDPFAICGGFGYVDDDYRVVAITRPNNTDGHDALDSKVLVYSLKTNSWKYVKDICPHFMFQDQWGTFASESLFWVTTIIDGSNRIGALFVFDFREESCYFMSPPKFEVKTYSMGLRSLGGCLTILSEEPNDLMNLWVLNRYGKEDSWSKLFSVKQLHAIGRFANLRPLMYSKSGKDVLLELDNEKIIWFDLERNEVKDVIIGGIPCHYRMTVYPQSLVHLNDDFNSDEEQQKLQEKMINEMSESKLGRAFVHEEMRWGKECLGKAYKLISENFWSSA